MHKFGIDFNLFDRADAETIRSAGQTSTAKRDKLTLLMQKPTKVMCRGLLGPFLHCVTPFTSLSTKMMRNAILDPSFLQYSFLITFFIEARCHNISPASLSYVDVSILRIFNSIYITWLYIEKHLLVTAKDMPRKAHSKGRASADTRQVTAKGHAT